MSTIIENVSISTFINPHLFWVIESNSVKRNETLKQLKKELMSLIENDLSTKDFIFEIGQLVAVEVNKQIYRAVIENIYSDAYDIESESDLENIYLCWLIDYATMVEAKQVHKLPLSLRKIPCLAMQVCLSNIGFIQQHLVYNDRGQPVIEQLLTTAPSKKCRETSIEIISTFKTLNLQIDSEEDGIYFGDIINEDSISLKRKLIDCDVLKEDKGDVCSAIKTGINDYREKHLRLITTVCKNNYKILEDEGSNSIENALQQIKIKSLKDFDDNEEVSGDEWFFNRRSQRLNRSKKTGGSSSDAPNSSEELNNTTDSEAGIEKLMKLWQQKKIPKPFFRSNDNIERKREIKQGDTIKRMNEVKVVNQSKDTLPSVTQTQSGSKSNYFEAKHPKKHNLPGNCLFMPAGASRTVIGNSLSKNKTTRNMKNKPAQENINENSWNDESSESSCKRSIQEGIKKSDSNEDTEYKTDNSSHANVNDSVNANQLVLKPHCSCAQCIHWTDSKDWIKNPEYSQKTETKLVSDLELSFFKKDGVGELCNILSIDYGGKTEAGKKYSRKVLIHGENIPSPAFLISQVNFHPNVLQILLRRDYREAKRIQMYTWQSLLRNHNIFMVHDAHTGKTMSYLPVMCTFILEKEERYQHVPKVGGPIIVILCSNSRKCEDIYALAKLLLGNNRSKVFLITYPNASAPLHNIEILITTPTILIDLLKCHKINFKRLCHLVIEDGTKIINRDQTLLDKILHLIDKMLKNRKFAKAVQFVMCVEHWNIRLTNLLTTLGLLPLVCIGNYLEAALYGGMEFSMKFTDSACKRQEFTRVIKETYRIFKTIVFCENSDIEELKTLLMLKGVEATVIDDELDEEVARFHEELWAKSKGGQHIVLVCTDSMFNTMMSITSAAILIHFSLPNNWTKFVKRFSSLLESCKSPVDSKKTKGVCRSIVFCDEHSEDQMFKFFNYINETDLKYQLPEKLKQFSENLKRTKEEEKIIKGFELCDVMKLFGKCTESRCIKRHSLKKNLDVIDYLPKSGKIRFKIVDILDVTYFSIEIIQDIDNEKNKDNAYGDGISEKLTNTLKIDKKKVFHLILGHYYVFYECDKDVLFYRCRLLEFEHDDSVRIILVDRGNIIVTKKTRLFTLPEEFSIKTYHPKIVEMYLTNCIPPYQDECFSSKAFSKFKSQLEQMNYKKQIFVGEISMQISNIFWLNDVYEEKVLSDDSVIPGLQLARYAASLQLIQYNQHQYKSLQKLCDIAGISVPKILTQKNPVKKKDKPIPQWAYLDVDKPNELIFSSAVSPDEFYVRLNKFNDLLYMLEKEIQNDIRRPHYPKLHSVESGDLCLARLPEADEYNRALVLKTENDKALCVFVDFGDEIVTPISDLKYLEDALITKLPFQSIQCTLYGVKAVLNEWQDEAINILYDYSVEPQTDIFRSLFAKVCAKGTSSITNQNKYSVLLKDGFGDRNIVINQLLIDCGLASPTFETITDFELPEIKIESDDELNGEIEEITNIYRKTEEIDENYHPTGEHSNFHELSEMELFADDPLIFFNELSSYKKEEKEGPVNRELPAIKAVESVDYCTPEVFWYQTEKVVRLNVKITDTNDCHVNLTKNRILNFRATKNGQLYCLKLMLYESVTSVQHTLSGPDIRITLTKSKAIDWPRLIISKQHPRNIHYDLTMLKVDENNHKKFLEIPKELDNESHSDDSQIDLMYHVYSDLDSEFDAELERDSD